MVNYTVSGTALDPETAAPLTGLWSVRRFASFTAPADFITDPEVNYSLYVAPGRNAALSLEETSGTELYWAKFTSSDGETELGPYLFTLTGDRTWNDVMSNPAPTPASGGGDNTPTYVEVGPGSVTLNVSTYTKILWSESADFPMREDQFTLDGDTLTCIEAGTYRIDLYLLPGVSTDLGAEGTVAVESAVEVNGGNKGPAWNFYPRVTFPANSASQKSILAGSFPQALEVGDEITVPTKAYQYAPAVVLNASVSPQSGHLMLTKLA